MTPGIETQQVPISVKPISRSVPSPSGQSPSGDTGCYLISSVDDGCLSLQSSRFQPGTPHSGSLSELRGRSRKDRWYLTIEDVQAFLAVGHCQCLSGERVSWLDMALQLASELNKEQSFQSRSFHRTWLIADFVIVAIECTLTSNVVHLLGHITAVRRWSSMDLSPARLRALG